VKLDEEAKGWGFEVVTLDGSSSRGRLASITISRSPCLCFPFFFVQSYLIEYLLFISLKLNVIILYTKKPIHQTFFLEEHIQIWGL
jgi:hypothetical protein